MTDRPAPLLDHPALSTLGPDPLSDVLATIRLTGALFFLTDLAPPVPAARVPDGRIVARALAPNAQNVVSYHVVVKGRMGAGLSSRVPCPSSSGSAREMTAAWWCVVSSAATWRMQLAAQLLADGHTKVSGVARDVGYDSEAAFSRAFKRATGVGPARWRERQHALTVDSLHTCGAPMGATG